MMKFTRRLFSHVWLVATEFLYGIVRARQPIGIAANFLAMRLLTPFGFFRGWDRLGAASSDPVIATLSRTGFAELRPRTRERVEALKAFFCRYSDAPDGRRYENVQEYFDHYRGQRVQRPRGLIATGDPDCLLSQIAFDEDFVGVAATFLGVDRSRMVASASIDALIRLDQPRTTVGYDDALEFHRDIDSYRFVKIFVFLTDVARGGGHHEVFLNTQGRTPLALGPIDRYTDIEIGRAIGEARLYCVEGPAGYAFAENTFAFHRGTKPRTTDRLILNLIYMEDTFKKRYHETFSVQPGKAFGEAA